MKATVDAREMEGLDQLLGQIPPLVIATGGPLDRAVGKAGQVIAKRARQLAPNSKRTGSKDKQSEKARKIWVKQIKNTIRSVVRRYPTTALAVVGPKAPEGNAAHFNQEKPRKMVLWGKATRIRPYSIARDWIVQAFDETKAEQGVAMETSLKQDIDKVMRGG